MTRFRRVTELIPLYATIPLLIALNWFLFRRLAHKNYFLWYLEYGSIIGLATTFFRLFVNIEEHQEGLISSHPIKYIRDTFRILSAFFASFANLLPERVGKQDVSRVYSDLWDTLGVACLFIIVMASVFAWLLVVVPLNYLVTLIGGAPARSVLRFESQLPPSPAALHAASVSLDDAIRNLLSTFPMLREESTIVNAYGATPPNTDDATPNADDAITPKTPVPKKGKYASPSGPFELTQAFNALLLWVASVVYSRFA